MWGFATQAGAGMAIAGLTATYYALANRNLQDEMERLPQVGNGDGDGPDKHEQQDESESNKMPAASLILKKELEELNVMNGSVSGLNILYQQQSPLNQLNRSTFEITPPSIGPRAELSPSEETIRELEASIQISARSSNEDNAEEILDFEDLDAILNPEEDGLEDDSVPADNEDNPIQVEKTTEEKRKEPPKENILLTKTSSPICFFKNPGFGNRYAFKLKQEQEATPLVARASQLSCIELEAITSPDSSPCLPSESKECQDSTQFILSPILSESNASIIEKDTAEKLRIHGKRKQASSIQINPAVEISEYNETLKKKRLMTKTGKMNKKRITHRSLARIRIRTDPKNYRFRTVSKGSGKPVMLPPEVAKTLSEEKLKIEAEIAANHHHHPPTEVTFEKKAFEIESSNEFCKLIKESRGCEVESISEGVFEEPLLVPSRMCLTSITRSQRTITLQDEAAEEKWWKTLPVRVYRDSMRTMPWPLLLICALVVVIAGFVGMFLTQLANEVANNNLSR